MPENESNQEQAAEFQIFKSVVDRLTEQMRSASPDKLRAAKKAIESLMTTDASSSTEPAAPETQPESAEAVCADLIGKFNRGEAYGRGEKANGSLWIVRTAEGRVFLLPNPSEYTRSRYPEGDLTYYYPNVDERARLKDQRLTKFAEIKADGKIPDDYYEKIKRNPGDIPLTNIKTGSFSS
ncbi:MAG: hypothetical protein V1664_02570 [Candidatus Uhrbacteria bacterium]